LEKTGREHVKATAQAEAIFSLDDTKEPSADASLMDEKFYSNVWMKGDREMVDEAIKKSEKESHDAREEATQAKEAAECAMIIGILLKVFILLFVSSFEIHHYFLYYSRPFVTTGTVQP
jgi:hypothetical protein